MFTCLDYNRQCKQKQNLLVHSLGKLFWATRDLECENPISHGRDKNDVKLSVPIVLWAFF